MYDSIATLKTPTTSSIDSYGNEILTYAEKQVYVVPRAVYHAEYYQAAQVGLHPSITFEMSNRADYDGEKLIAWNGKDYEVIRADWTGAKDKIALICEERVVNG